MKHITSFDPTKRRTQLVIWAFHKVFKDAPSIRVDNQCAGAKHVQALQSLIEDVAAKTKSPYHAKSFQEMAEILLWIYYKDSAYRDQGDYILSRLLELAPEMDIEAKPADEWYVNIYEDARQATNRRKKEGVDSMGPLNRSLSNKDFMERFLSEAQLSMEEEE